MEILAGFLIALAIGLTGIGGGVLTAPVLMLFMGRSALEAVGTALVFAAGVKIFAAPVYLLRRQVDFRILGLMLAGGVPGVLGGAWLLSWLHTAGLNAIVLAIVGLTVVVCASANLLRRNKPVAERLANERRQWLPGIAALIGLEVGFSSAGAGVLGTITLLHFTALAPAAVVGTDVMFGLGISLAGGGFHLTKGALDTAILWKLLAGGIPGAVLGSYMATVVPARALRIGLSIWLVYLGSQLLYKGVGTLFYGG